jgi:hypothetical protein
MLKFLYNNKLKPIWLNTRALAHTNATLVFSHPSTYSHRDFSPWKENRGHAAPIVLLYASDHPWRVSSLHCFSRENQHVVVIVYPFPSWLQVDDVVWWTDKEKREGEKENKARESKCRFLK